MKVVFTGSSLLEINKGEADLSRRAVRYHMHGLSFREFLQFEYNDKIEPQTIENIIENHVAIAIEVNRSIKPIVAFREYLQFGYFGTITDIFPFTKKISRCILVRY